MSVRAPLSDIPATPGDALRIMRIAYSCFHSRGVRTAGRDSDMNIPPTGRF